MRIILKLLPILTLFAFQDICLAQKVHSRDSLKISRNGYDSLQNYLNSLSAVQDKVNKLSDVIDAKANNIMTANGNVIAWCTIIVGLLAIAFGGITLQTYVSSKKGKAKVKKAVKDIESKASEVEELRSKLETEKTKYEEAKTEFERKLLEYNEEFHQLKKKYENDKRNVEDYSDACDKLDEGSIEIAKKKFRKILERQKDFHQATSKLAMCYSADDNNLEAIRIISSMIAMNGSFLEAYSSEGIILRRLSKFDEAIASFLKALPPPGGVPLQSTYTHIGYCYLYKGDYDAAAEYFTKGKETDHTSPAYYGLVKADLLKTREVNAAMLKEAIAVSNYDVLENFKYPYHRFGQAFLQMCLNTNGEDFIRKINETLLICKNIGILKEQLWEYKLVKEKGLNFDRLDECIEILQNRISAIKRTIEAYQEVAFKQAV